MCQFFKLLFVKITRGVIIQHLKKKKKKKMSWGIYLYTKTKTPSHEQTKENSLSSISFQK